MKRFAAIIALISFNASAACVYKVTPDTTKVSWTAYKTPKKVGVGGEFKKFTVKSPESAASIDELVAKTTFDIDASSVSTTNPDRDKKIVSNFFTSKGKVIAINGKVTKVAAKEVTAALTLGTTTKDVMFTKAEAGDKTTLSSQINVMDYNLKSNLEAITAACKALHEGVTWPEVMIAVEFQTTKTCN